MMGLLSVATSCRAGFILTQSRIWRLSESASLGASGEDTETKTGTKGKPDGIAIMSSLDSGPGRPRSGFHVCAWDFSGPGDRRSHDE